MPWELLYHNCTLITEVASKDKGPGGGGLHAIVNKAV